MNSEQIRREVTDRVIALLESGNVSAWVKPWVTFGGPRNLGTGRKYTGLLNILLLQATAMKEGFEYPLWATYNQIRSLEAHVFKGEHSSRVVLWKVTERKRNRDQDSESSEVPENESKANKGRGLLLQYFNVFNIEQTTLDAEKFTKKFGWTLNHHVPVAGLEEFVKAQKIQVEHGGDRACYRVGSDEICMPVMQAFQSEKDYYATLFHELVHATGHVSRLNRNQTGRFGSDEYAREELIAELGSLYLCAELGLEGKLQHPEYLKSWIDVLRSDSREILKVAGQATKAVDLLLTNAQLRETVEHIELAS